MESINPVFIYARKRLPRALSWLPLFVIFSLFAHIGALVVFQIIYPTPATGLRRSAEVYFLKPGSPEAEKLTPWLDSADPALSSRFLAADHPLLAQAPLEYVPSFDLLRPHIPTLPAEPLVPETGIHLRPTPRPSPIVPEVASPQTRVTFSELLASRKFEPAPNFNFAPIQGDTPENPIFSVAVADDGRPLFVLLAQSSGQTELDVRAREYLLRGRFAPTAQETSTPTWGRATFFWPRPATPPAP